MKLFFLILLESWKDFSEEDKAEMHKRLDDPSSWDESPFDSKEEWKYYAMSLGILGNPELSATKIAFRYYLNVIRLLEDEIGEITFVTAIKELEGDHRDKYLTYFFSRIKSHEIKFALRDSIEVAMCDEQNIKNKTDLIVQKLLTTDNEYAIERYSNTYEFIFENFINPIFEAAEQSLNIPREIYMDWKTNFNPNICPNHLKLATVSAIFERDERFEPLRIWVSDVNVRSRNSLIHEQYYIRDDIINYYYKDQGRIIFESIDVKKIKDFNAGNFIRLFVTPVVIALKIIEDENLLDVI